jgi:rubrerythrin
MDDTQVKAPAPEKGRVVVPKEGSALRRLAEDDSSRKRFLKMVGGAGAASAFTLLLAACGGDEEETGGQPAEGGDTGQAAGMDLDILNYALTLEFLEAGFYQAVIDAGVIKDQMLAEVATTFGEHEQEHVDALTATIEQMGGTPAEEPQADFEPVIQGGPDEVLATAARVENVGAAAYLNEAAQIQSEEVLAAALSIHTVEARHAAALNAAAGLNFTGGDQFEGSIPDGAFAAPADRDTVMQEIQPFLAGGGGGN